MQTRIVRKSTRTRTGARSGAPLVEKLEERQLLSTSPVFAGTKIKGINLSSNGISTNQTLITIPFTGNINIADASKIQVRGYAIDPLTGHQRKMVVGVVSTNIVAADHSYLQITTDRLMRKGGQIILYSGGLKDDNGDFLAQQTVKTVKGQNKERFTLACRAFTATDLTKFNTDLYSTAPSTSPAGTAVPEATARANLLDFFQEKVNLGLMSTTNRNKLMDRFDATVTKNIIPDPNMRAALLSLGSTFAESAITVYLDGNNPSGQPYTILGFDTPPDPSVPIAQTIINSKGRNRTVLRPEYRGESFQALSAILAHEALHQDTTVGLPEEEFANVAETMVYAQQALVDPTFLSAKTQLVNRENESLYAMLNSGRAIFPYVGLKDGPIRHGPSVFNGSDVAPSDGHGDYTSFSNYIERQYIARGSPAGLQTPGNNMLDIYYTVITGTTPPSGMQFSDSIINTIDSFQTILSTTNAITLASDLKLGIS